MSHVIIVCLGLALLSGFFRYAPLLAAKLATGGVKAALTLGMVFVMLRGSPLEASAFVPAAIVSRDAQLHVAITIAKRLPRTVASSPPWLQRLAMRLPGPDLLRQIADRLDAVALGVQVGPVHLPWLAPPRLPFLTF